MLPSQPKEQRSGVRGGLGLFRWDTVVKDKDRENYLGHSAMAPFGRWQRNKDLHWYKKQASKTEEAQSTIPMEIQERKIAEAEALAIALGIKPTALIGNPNLAPVGEKKAIRQQDAEYGEHSINSFFSDQDDYTEVKPKSKKRLKKSKRNRSDSEADNRDTREKHDSKRRHRK